MGGNISKTINTSINDITMSALNNNLNSFVSKASVNVKSE